MTSETGQGKPFHFKQFSVNHQKSTMKVGTDSILLATWCNIENTKNILDIGTGSGVIALLLAARSQAKIDAIELDRQSAEEASNNFVNSPFGNQLSLHHIDFNNFAKSSSQKYDLIISNPPYFSNDLLPDSPSKRAARHINNLTHQKLCEGVTNLLDTTGCFCLVLPAMVSSKFIKVASRFNLILHKKQLVFPVPNSHHNRVNMEFRFGQSTSVKSESIIIRSENGSHTEEYRNFVSEYLINI